jgi:hypothetical protein
MEPYIGALLIVVGIPLCFLGLKLIKPSVCFAGFLTTTLASCLIFYLVYFTDLNETSAFWYFLAGGALAGLLLGLLLAKFIKFGAAVLAGWGGFAAGLILNEAVLFRFEQEWLFWVSIVACVIVAAVLAFFAFEHAIILSSAFLGSYCLVRGVSCYAGHYYNEFTIIELLKSGAISDIDPYYWCYVAGFVVFTIAGSIVQYKTRPRKDTHPYNKMQ